MKINKKVAAFIQAQSKMLTSRDFIISVVGTKEDDPMHVQKNFAGLVAADGLCVFAALIGPRRNWATNYLKKAKRLAEGKYTSLDRVLALLFPRLTWHSQQILLVDEGAEEARLFDETRAHYNGSFLDLFAKKDKEGLEKDRRQIAKWAGPIYEHLKDFHN